MYDARCIANEFIRRAGDQGHLLTHLQIQKLVYFSHARLLVLHRQPLVDKDFEAWEYGPVVPSLYHALKPNRSDGVSEEIPIDQPVFSSREKDIFNWCFKRYGHLSGRQLTVLTHADGSPWSRAVGRNDTVISTDDIADYHAIEWREESLNELERIHRLPAFQRLVDESFTRDDSHGYTLEELQQRIDQSAHLSA